jgi:uncharacterized protein (DUF924 family)
MTADTIIRFWFEEIDRKLWFKKDPDFDTLLRQRFGSVHQRACAGELLSWRETASGALAEVIVLDQFSRNLFRDSPLAFAQDGLALVLAQEAVRRGLDQQLSPTMKAFLYMPYMHSESALIHDLAVQLFDQPGLEGNLDFELRHKAIIDRFGRYPHRNAVLGRTSTPEEEDFLRQPGSSF